MQGLASKKPRRDPGKPFPANIRALSASDFTFHGFEDLRRFGFLREVGIRSGEPQVSFVEDGTFIPRSKAAGNWPAILGGIVTKDGRVVETANLRRLGTAIFAGLQAPIEVEPVRHLDEEVFYAGWLFDAYGHLLLESLARCWYLQDIEPAIRVVFHAERPPQAGGMTQQILAAFGIPVDRMIWLDEPTLIRRIIVPEPLYELGYVAHERAAEAHRVAATRIIGKVTPSGQPLYISRRKLASDRRAIVGEAELEDLLRANGFRIAYPETLSFAEQVSMINSHSDIFACDGSAAHGVLFALGAPRMHLLIGATVSPDYFLSSTVAHASVTFVNSLESREGPAIGRSFPHLINLRKVAKYLSECGFLKQDEEVGALTQLEVLRQRRDEVWYCRLMRLAGDGREVSPEDEVEARRMAVASWPLSWLLLRYDLRREDRAVDGLVNQFTDLLAVECDPERLAHHRREMAMYAKSILPELTNRCDSVTVMRLKDLLSKHDMLNASV